MFSTLRSRLLLGIYIFVVLSIPVGAYLASQTQNIKSNAQETIVKNPPKSTTSGAKELLSTSESSFPTLNTLPSPSPEDSSPTVASSFGPTLSLSALLEARPISDQSTKLFVGILEGGASSNPRFILSFSVDLPSSGKYDNLSLAGLTAGNTYTALLKGTSQIATSSAFVMSPTVTSLNEGQALNLLSGDLNEDNTINSSDYSIIQKAFGSISSSDNWNESADFNKDGRVNSFDLAVVTRNLGKTGATGIWTSSISASSSASLTPGETSTAIGGPEGASLPAGRQGYWLWVPQ